MYMPVVLLSESLCSVIIYQVAWWYNVKRLLSLFLPGFDWGNTNVRAVHVVVASNSIKGVAVSHHVICSIHMFAVRTTAKANLVMTESQIAVSRDHCELDVFLLEGIYSFSAVFFIKGRFGYLSAHVRNTF